MRITTTEQLLVVLIALPVAAFILYWYFQLNPPLWWIWWSFRRKPPQPQKPEKRRRPGWLARLRARRGVRHGKNRWTTGFSSFIWPTSIKVDDLKHHALVCGATGSGKTSALQLLVDAFAGKMPMVIVDCKASMVMRNHIEGLPDNVVWTIGGTTRWDPLRGDATSVANRLIQGEWYSRDADVYRAAAERYLLWLLHALGLANQNRTPEKVLEYLDPTRLIGLLRDLNHPEAERLVAQINALVPVEKEGLAGFRARFGVVLDGVAAASLGNGFALDDAIRARRPVLFSLDAATY